MQILACLYFLQVDRFLSICRETCRVERVIPPGDYGKQLLAEESPPSTTKSESNEVMIVGENGEVTEVVIVQEEKAVAKT